MFEKLGLTRVDNGLSGTCTAAIVRAWFSGDLFSQRSSANRQPLAPVQASRVQYLVTTCRPFGGGPVLHVGRPDTETVPGRAVCSVPVPHQRLQPLSQSCVGPKGLHLELRSIKLFRCSRGIRC